ncbi:MBL fold metallo-hydrolase [Pseudoalteromonas tunicata]|uniref:MBL fold metallo-hydrolase n=1 Tax=Pseudoalteromonas tunicata TaxID=314281 RepID=UPI00273FE174|nr:MBL fold metallo-hydrolase [Pseudoalteromonas tunicata]MDP4983541.1 MBL fold metallo-hydrolase [Pseudoalteromonas tunicata]MDP5211889.1 MBL fold metallo-hydrolase [Pseudoalteromonas tunicata]
MKVTFYGTRGSIPTPGPNTVIYGGNTACVLLEANNKKLILDSGTGIRLLGERLAKETDSIHILLSHNHWDHIQGFPFFVPAYQANRTIHIYSAPTEPMQPKAILEQMERSFFPVPPSKLSAKIHVHSLTEEVANLNIAGFEIITKAINHPNGGFAYKISCDNKTIAYVTDNELYSKDNLKTSLSQWHAFLADVDLLIHDAQYTDSEMPSKLGWGHSSIAQAITLGQTAKVKQLILYSHAPERTDNELNAVLAQYDKNQPMQFDIAKEGQVIHL